VAQEKILDDEVLAWADQTADGQEQENEQFEHPRSIADLGPSEVLPSHSLGGLVALAVLVVALVTALDWSSPVRAQGQPPSTGTTSIPTTDYRVTLPAIQNYVRARGGARTFGDPLSADFVLLGKHLQVFQRQVVELRPDGSVGTLDLLGTSFLPITHLDGQTLPSPDPAVIAAAPVPGDADYLPRALAFVAQTVPDTWNGLPVQFQTTYQASVTCADAFADQVCDEGLLPAFALELWGLPTSMPAQDPNNAATVYQRFERGVLAYSTLTGQTGLLPMGAWFKRVLVGTDLPPDLQADVAGSRFYAQVALGRPLGLARPQDLPDTSLTLAFQPDDGFTSAEVAPVPVLQTATAVSATATAAIANGTATIAPITPMALGTGTVLAAPTAVSAATTVVSGAPPPNPVVVPPNPVVVPPVASGTPVSNAGCLGDEQMWFVPRRPALGTHVTIAVTSQRHHDVRYLALAGPVDAGPATERPGAVGWVWTWTVVPAVETFYQWTFYADGLRPCITSGFNTTLALGATATPTTTPQPTSTAGPTSTPTVATPSVASLAPTSGGCATTLTILGTGFGTPERGQTTPVGGQVFFGGRAATVINWTNTAILIGIPSGASAGPNAVTVSVPGGGFSQGPAFTLMIGAPAASAPTATATVAVTATGGTTTLTATPTATAAPVTSCS